MFGLLLYNLRNQGIKVGISQWLTLMKALRQGLVTHLDDLYGLGRSIFCSSHEQFDAYGEFLPNSVYLLCGSIRSVNLTFQIVDVECHR